MRMMNRLEKYLCGGEKARKRLITSSSARTARRSKSRVLSNKRPHRLRCSNCGKSILIGKISAK